MPNVKFDLRAWRESLGIKPAKLAALFGVSKPQIWRLEKQGAVPQIYIWACKGYAQALKENQQNG